MVQSRCGAFVRLNLKVCSPLALSHLLLTLVCSILGHTINDTLPFREPKPHIVVVGWFTAGRVSWALRGVV